MFTRRPAVPSRRRIVPRRVNIEFFASQGFFSRSTNMNIVYSRSGISIEIQLEELDQQVGFPKSLDFIRPNMISTLTIVSSRNNNSLEIEICRFDKTNQLTETS